ncbi:MAG TPA: NAD(P)H-dependent glycerol-3-phosphate dehydrogenase [Pyrinomonadaceae bacterium]|jgi:glycerol-3-phosphate dehydrogenase (NAD(P)+)|nr:NAD(P)H-dependent glycerol-3-phosphate dehydrogenase [Pyrinomonadaceae bacterium]
MKRRVAVIGAGSWGTALAIIAARAGHEVVIWSRNEAVVESINRDRVNAVYLTDAVIPNEVEATRNISAAVAGRELIILAAPSDAARELLTAMLPELRAEMIIVSATKGIEIDTGKRMSQVVDEVVTEAILPRFVCLSGPSFAREVVENHPTAIVAASADREAGRIVQRELSFDNLRLYTNDDVAGTELGGSVKNVMAIAAGMVAGLGFGSNSIAALITRGLAEMTRLALREGAKLETLMGLAGLGDLVLTCTGSLSRNRFVGQELGNGRSLNDIAAGMNEVAEGVNTTLAVKRLANRIGVDMPITNEVHAVLYEGKSASDAANELMTRPLREESNE